jgi:hypothetical protein
MGTHMNSSIDEQTSSPQDGYTLQTRAQRRRTQVLMPLLLLIGALLAVVGLTVQSVERRNNRNSAESALDDASSASSSSYFAVAATVEAPPPPPPAHLQVTCGAPNVKTLAGAMACEEACSAARCCTDTTCWNSSSNNKEVCMQYHEYCLILDGVLSTGQVHELPIDYKGGWFDDEHNDHSQEAAATAAVRGKTILPPGDPNVVAQLARDDACRNHQTTKQGLNECVKLCIPATCCHASSTTTTEQHVVVDFCQAPNSLDRIDCRHYHACDVLYTP